MYTYHTFRDCPCGHDSALQAADVLADAIEAHAPRAVLVAVAAYRKARNLP